MHSNSHHPFVVKEFLTDPVNSSTGQSPSPLLQMGEVLSSPEPPALSKPHTIEAAVPRSAISSALQSLLCSTTPHPTSKYQEFGFLSPLGLESN